MSWIDRAASRFLARLLGIARTAIELNNPSRPLDAILFCPACGYQHIDAPCEAEDWTNPPHRSHRCADCGQIWRPMDVATNGVAEIATIGKHDDEPPIRGRAFRRQPRGKRRANA